VRLTREEAAAKAQALDLAPYDVLLDGYEPGVRSAQIDSLLDPLAAFLPDFLEQVLARQTKPLPLHGRFAPARQMALGRELMARMGFDFEHGRLDQSTHPYCGGVSDDIRLTARYEEADVTSGLMAILHETGHALYSAGLPQAWRHQPVGQARGMAVHESQSLLIEMQVCRSPAFLSYLAPLLARAFDRADPALSADNLYRRAIHVERGHMRVDADEVTYPLHVILRYRLEKALLDDRLEVADLPGAWNDAMQDLLGLTPPDDSLGCLQDIHWPIGAIGYFPCYTLGAIMAAQLFDTAKGAEPDIMPALERGDFSSLLAWLRANIHEQGSLMDMPELLTRATGRPLELQPFLDHLRARYH
jgi:carboxypeptidase Taq